MRKVGVNYWTLPGRFDGFLAGSIAGVIIFMPKKVEISQKWAGGLIGFGWFLSVVALARLLWSGYNSYYNHTKFLEGIWIDVTCYTIISVVLVLWMVKIDIRGRRVGRLQSGFAFLGLISYEIYLVHFPIVTLLKKAYNFNFHNGALVLFPLTLLISSVVGYYMHKILTAPALKKREQIHSFLAGLAARFRPQPAELGTTGISIDEPATVQLSSATRKLG
jgi:peptidoglycan/LPS O-acetylase OafA/YrhL